jgi:organic radical activating enzyme
MAELLKGSELMYVKTKCRIWCQYCDHKYLSGKMRLDETIPGMGDRVVKEN